MNRAWITVKLFVLMMILTGIIYPFLILGIAKLGMPNSSKGGLVTKQNKVIGAHLIGQKFENDSYFWGRPSAVDYNTLPSGGSNLGPTSKKLKKAVEERKQYLAKSHEIFNNSKIPAELLFTSGSGLDPHISLTTAYFQVPRIAKARNLAEKDIKSLINKLKINPLWGLFGESYVNVLELNLSLEEI